MYYILQKILADKTDGVAFKCFGIWHICFILFFVIIAVLLALHAKKKAQEERTKIINAVIAVAVGLYAADVFLMPFAYGEISIDKLPFHVCTTMCVMCFWSRYNAFLGKFRLQFAMLGFLSNLVYLFYPGAMMWMGLHPLSYRVVQTIAFHGVMMIYGLLVLIYERQAFAWKKIYKDFGVIVAMTIWARLGNALYSNDEETYNWFFVNQDPFNAFPESIALYTMPFLNIAIFFAVEMLVYLIFFKASSMYKSKEIAKT